MSKKKLNLLTRQAAFLCPKRQVWVFCQWYLGWEGVDTVWCFSFCGVWHDMVSEILLSQLKRMCFLIETIQTYKNRPTYSIKKYILKKKKKKTSQAISWKNINFIIKHVLHPGRLTWNLQITHLERNDLPNLHEDMFHVNLQGCRFVGDMGSFFQQKWWSKHASPTRPLKSP